MRCTIHALLAFAAAVAAPSPTLAGPQDQRPLTAPEASVPVRAHDYVGPENGTLLVVGGGDLSDAIFTRFIALAGGPSAPLVVVPTAGGDPAGYGPDAWPAPALRRLAGPAARVDVLHTYDRAEADTEAFVAPLLRGGGARGLWFAGGRQWRLVDAYAGTRAEAAFRRVLEGSGGGEGEGGVIAGTSAGASIMGSFLVRGDTETNLKPVGDHTVGFGYMKNTAIDQHVLVRNRHFDMFEVLRDRPELLGFGCDENTALVVHRNAAHVEGASYCVMYDGGFWSREGGEHKSPPGPESVFYFLKEGDRYDLGARKVERSRSPPYSELDLGPARVFVELQAARLVRLRKAASQVRLVTIPSRGVGLAQKCLGRLLTPAVELDDPNR
ncbi:hypothetical protein GGR56DRAFT_694874 [Xylariaceae sp. FL0804]|nr:hypothetical protein GGR56DRAFT_694874 [Xylariaceae sp. FL0804]